MLLIPRVCACCATFLGSFIHLKSRYFIQNLANPLHLKSTVQVCFSFIVWLSQTNDVYAFTLRVVNTNLLRTLFSRRQRYWAQVVERQLFQFMIRTCGSYMVNPLRVLIVNPDSCLLARNCSLSFVMDCLGVSSVKLLLVTLWIHLEPQGISGNSCCYLLLSLVLALLALSLLALLILVILFDLEFQEYLI